MELLINIPERLYTSLKERPATHAENLAIYEYIVNGTPVSSAKEKMIAILIDIQSKLDEMKITKVHSAGFAPYSKDPFRRGVNCSKDIIQQKINSLKAEVEPQADKEQTDD